MLVGLFSGIGQPGGIQRYSSITAKVLHHIAGQRGQKCEILSLNDSDSTVGDQDAPIVGFDRHKVRLLTHVTKYGWSIDTLFIGHVNLAPVGLYLRVLNPHLRYWVAAHGVEVWSRLPWLTRAALRRSSGVAAVSTHTAAQVVRIQGVDARKVSIVPNVIETPGSRSGLPALSVGARCQVVLTVARLEAHEMGKGVDMVLRALPCVRDQIPDVLYIVVGSGTHIGALRRLAEELGVSDQVLFVGNVDDATLAAYYARADVFAMPSRQEGFGIVFLEAMANGKPVIGGNCGGTPDIVHDGINGYLVDPSDVDGIARHLITLFGHPDLREQLGAAGRDFVLSNFTVDHHARRLATLIAS